MNHPRATLTAALTIAIGASSAGCAHAPPASARVSIMHTRAVSLENMLSTFERDGVEDRAYVLVIAFARLYSGAVEEVDVTCQAGDVALRARAIGAAPGNERYEAYMYTDRASSRRLREGYQEVRCAFTLDRERHAVATEAYLSGPPLGTPFERLDPPLVAMDCDTGARPRSGRPVCVHLHVENRNLSASSPRAPLAARCTLAGEAAATETSVSQLRYGLEVRFDQGAPQGAHALSCAIVGHEETRSEATVDVLAAPPGFALEVLEIGTPQLAARLPLGDTTPPRYLHVDVDVRALGDSPLWGMRVQCVSDAPPLEMSGYRLVRHDMGPTADLATRPLGVGERATVRASARVPYDTESVDTGALRCVAEATTRDGSRVIARSAERTSPPPASPRDP